MKLKEDSQPQVLLRVPASGRSTIHYTESKLEGFFLQILKRSFAKVKTQIVT
jgi:hypothetical protein